MADSMLLVLAREVLGTDVDARELEAIVKAMPDSSSVSTPGAIAPPTPGEQKKRKAIVGGLLLGTVAEGSAVAHAARDVMEPGGNTKLKAGHLALQAVNAGVGLAAARELVKKPKPASTVSKRKLIKVVSHVTPEALVRANARARRNGVRLVGATGTAAAAGGGYAAGRHTRPPRVTPQVITGNVGKAVSGAIVKFDEDKRQIFGWANLAIVDGQQVIDLQGDYVAIEEIEKSAYSYMLTSRKGGDMHRRIAKLDGGPVHVADIIESMVFTPEKLIALGLEPDALPLGWWTGMQIHRDTPESDEVWRKVKNGEYTGLSIHGSGVRRDMVMA